jgi:hypothetical protein
MSNEAWVEELLRKSIVIDDRNGRHKKAFAKKIAEDEAAYEAAYIESRGDVDIQYTTKGTQ